MKTFKQLRENYRSNEPLYHVTTLKGLSGIIKSGKILPRAYRGERSGDMTFFPRGNFGKELDGHSRGRIHLTSDIKYWANTVMNASGKNIIVLRIAPQHISKYKVRSSYNAMRHRDRYERDNDTLRVMYDYDPNEIGRDLFVTTTIPINHLEIQNKITNSWDKISFDISVRDYIYTDTDLLGY